MDGVLDYPVWTHFSHFGFWILPNFDLWPQDRRRAIKLITRCNAIISMRYQSDEDIQCPVCSHREKQCNVRFTISYSDILEITETC